MREPERAVFLRYPDVGLGPMVLAWGQTNMDVCTAAVVTVRRPLSELRTRPSHGHRNKREVAVGNIGKILSVASLTLALSGCGGEGNRTDIITLRLEGGQLTPDISSEAWLYLRWNSLDEGDPPGPGCRLWVYDVIGVELRGYDSQPAAIGTNETEGDQTYVQFTGGDSQEPVPDICVPGLDGRLTIAGHVINLYGTLLSAFQAGVPITGGATGPGQDPRPAVAHGSWATDDGLSGEFDLFDYEHAFPAPPAP
jgi:hypothetical protein